ncbi:MAG: queuine tRNA-ribosyltransferase, partial [Candidatus Krumholzibacteriia bacterium]
MSQHALDTPFSFTRQHTAPDCRARTGVLTTGHGSLPTPVFMPVGTVGSVKAVTFE